MPKAFSLYADALEKLSARASPVSGCLLSINQATATSILLTQDLPAPTPAGAATAAAVTTSPSQNPAGVSQVALQSAE